MILVTVFRYQLGLGEMKKRKDKIKETPKIRQKRTRESTINKQTNQKELNPWEEIRLKLQPLNKAYRIFREKRKIAKQKEEQRKLKEQEEQKLKEAEEQRLIKQKEAKLKKEKKLKAEEEKKLKAEEERRLKEKKIKEDQEEREKQAQIYKERLAKGELERLAQLDEADRLKEEQMKLIEERNVTRERRVVEEQKFKKEEKLKGKVKWFSKAKGYGFIEREDKEKDIFVHFSAVNNAGLKYLKEGEQLTFEIENTNKGPSAINLQKIS